MKTIKRPFKLNVLGVFRLETENMPLWEILLVIIIVMAFVITIIILLKLYAIPALTVQGFIKKGGAIIQSVRTRSP